MRPMDDRFERLLKRDATQVFLLACPASLPNSFAVHPWFVVNRKGALSRWEIFWRPEIDWLLRWGHLHKNFYEPFDGIAVYPWKPTPQWQQVRLLGVVDDEMLAARMADLIEESPEKYPYCNSYSLTGPNSNTYAQWVLNAVPECGLQLPWNSFGKGFIARQ